MLSKLFLEQLFEKYLKPALTLGENQVKKWSIGSVSAVSGEPFPVLHEFFLMLHTAVDIVLKTFSYFSSTSVSRLSRTATLKQLASMSSGSGRAALASSSFMYEEGKGVSDDDGPLQQFLSKTEALISKGLTSCINCLFYCLVHHE